MRAVWTLAKKELRLLLRDRVATVMLLGMPLVFILVLGLLLGEGFGQKADDRLRVSLVDLDQKRPCPIDDPAALRLTAGSMAGLLAAPAGQGLWLAVSSLYPGRTTYPTWSRVVQWDLAETAGIRVEIIDSLEEAQRLVAEHKRAAVLVFQPTFSDTVNRCSFLREGINPFFRDGVRLYEPGRSGKDNWVDAQLLKDGKQPGAAAIIEQVTQVSLMRVILPWMIGRAFDRLSDPGFLSVLAQKAEIPRFLLTEDFKARMGVGIKAALKDLFSKYDLTGKDWASLTRSMEQRQGKGAEVSAYANRDGSGMLARGAQRYQVLVPSYTVMFAFFLVLTVGWIFVAERRQGTLRRLRAAPLARWQVLLGKLIPCFLLSLGQGIFLLAAGRLLFGLRWGPENWPWWEQAAWLLPVIFCTSLAAMGLALLVAALARSEIQVALFGAVPVLVLALIGGCVLPRELMPEQTQSLALVTPQGWALDAYRELLDASPQYQPNTALVLRGCGALAAFGAGFLALAWGLMRLE